MDKLELPQISPRVLQSCTKEVQEYVAALQTFVQQLAAQVAELQSQLDQNSQNRSYGICQGLFELI